jgi:hypothetical protein
MCIVKMPPHVGSGWSIVLVLQRYACFSHAAQHKSTIELRQHVRPVLVLVGQDTRHTLLTTTGVRVLHSNAGINLPTNTGIGSTSTILLYSTICKDHRINTKYTVSSTTYN